MKIERLIGIIFYLINRECVTTNELAQKLTPAHHTDKNISPNEGDENLM